MKLPHQLISKKAYASMFASWYPETNLTVIDLDELLELQTPALLFFILMLFHEVIHSTEGGYVSPSSAQFSGTFLNISDLAFKSVEDILKSKNANLERTKSKILTNEIAIDRLFLASRNVVEIMAAYQFKTIIAPSFRVYNRVFTTNSAEPLKELKWQIPEEIIVQATRVLVRRGPETVRSWVSLLEQMIGRFLERSVKSPKMKLLHTKLADIGDLSGSRDLPVFVCRLALDVPFHHDISRWMTGLPLQFNPERRLFILLEGLEKLGKQAGKRAHSVLTRWMERAHRFDTNRELDEPIGKERGIKYYDSFSKTPKRIFFNYIAKNHARAKTPTILSQKDRNILFKSHMVKSFLRNPRDMICLWQRWGPLPVIGHTWKEQFRISFSPKYDCRFWKLGWCLNHLKDQVVSIPDHSLVVNPADIGYFAAPNYLRKDLMEPTQLARSLVTAPVPESLCREFERISKQLDKVIPTCKSFSQNHT